MTLAAALTMAALVVAASSSCEAYLANYEAGDFTARPTAEEMLADLRREYESSPQQSTRRERRQAPKGPSAVFPEISFRDMASVVAEAVKAVDARFEVCVIRR